MKGNPLLGLVCAILILGSGAAVGQSIEVSNQSLTLDDALELAVKHHPRLIALEHEIAAANARVTQAAATGYPLLDAGGLAKQGLSGAGSAFGLDGIAGSPFPDDLATSGSLSYEFLDFGRTEHRTAARNFELAAATETAKAERAKVVLEVTEAFFGALKSAQAETVAEADVRSGQIQLRQLKVLARSGLRSKLDVELAEVNLVRFQADAKRADNLYRTALADLRAAMGVGISSTAYSLLAPEVRTETPLPLQELIKNAKQNRPEIRAFDDTIKATEAWLEYAESERRPKFMASFSAGVARFAQLTLSNLTFGGIAFKLPLFSGKRLKAKVDEVSELLAMRRQLRSALVREVEAEVERAQGEVFSSSESVGANKHVAEHSHRALRLAQLKHQVELEDLAELTLVRARTTAAEAELAKSLCDYRIARAKLDFAVGSNTR